MFGSNRIEPRILIGCEFSQTVLEAWMDRGYDVYSCDLLPCEGPYPERHFQCDIAEVLDLQWDLIIIAHPPCTRLCNSGVRWLSKAPKKAPQEATETERNEWVTYSEEKKLDIMWRLLDEGAALFSMLWNSDCPLICIENPVMHKHAKERIENYENFSQSVQPWQFGHNESKRTCFWTKGLPNLVPDVEEKPENVEQRVHSIGPGKDRWKERSKFFPGIANAMAKQWGPVVDSLIAA